MAIYFASDDSHSQFKREFSSSRSTILANEWVQYENLNFGLSLISGSKSIKFFNSATFDSKDWVWESTEIGLKKI